MGYRLYYWPDIPGRGEFVRLALEAAAQPYEDVAGRGGTDRSVVADVLAQTGAKRPAFAPPVLLTEQGYLAQTATILQALGRWHDLAPRDEAGELWTQQLQLTLADWLQEIHDTHHPLGPDLYYEDQMAEAARRAQRFRQARLPAFLAYFERCLAAAPAAAGPYLVRAQITYADLSLFQIVAGLHFAFPTALGDLADEAPRVMRHYEAVAADPAIAGYLASGRRPAFNNDGIFRHYPELDG